VMQEYEGGLVTGMFGGVYSTIVGVSCSGLVNENSSTGTTVFKGDVPCFDALTEDGSSGAFKIGENRAEMIPNPSFVNRRRSAGAPPTAATWRAWLDEKSSAVPDRPMPLQTVLLLAGSAIIPRPDSVLDLSE
jgi:hypothetical protein